MESLWTVQLVMARQEIMKGAILSNTTYLDATLEVVSFMVAFLSLLQKRYWGSARKPMCYCRREATRKKMTYSTVTPSILPFWMNESRTHILSNSNYCDY
mmetsp:Transcript_25114/g.45462  ORF Transcript_25114/g.45462 Transcript_25114/m.45462 type:complete len:100 (+) Transcript_25114:4644-4943(+)